ncbi:MAG: DUF58 domain-containing protein [Candidatus Dormibacteria bacterium]
MTPRALWLGLACLGVVLAGAGIGWLTPLGLVLLSAWVLACLWDWRSAPDPADWRVTRDHPPALALGADNQIWLNLWVRAPRPCAVEVRDETPAEIECRPTLLNVALEPARVTRVGYIASPGRRGSYAFGRIVVRTAGPLGLWRRQVAVPAGEQIPVYPALAAIGRWEGLVRRGALQEMGVRSWRLYGEGTEFAGLRDYAPGDDPRRINWRASARMARPMTSEFEPERSRPIWLVLDCGRLMAGGQAGLTKLDTALSAALLLAWVALFRGDRVGALAVAGDVVAEISMRGGRSHYRRLLDGLVAVAPQPVDPDWELLTAQLRRRQGPRSLVVLFTDLGDPRVARELAAAGSSLRPRHLPLVVTQRDPVLERASTASPQDDRALYRRAAAVAYLEERSRALRGLRSLGVMTVDSGPEGITPQLVNRYLELKGRGLL